MKKSDTSLQNITQDHWLNAAYELLVESGVESVKIGALAQKLDVARTGFYWHFKDREALLHAMIERWEQKNTGNLIARAGAFSETIIEAILNVFDCWLDESLFDARFDLAIRNWARNDADLQKLLNTADAQRLDAISRMFQRFGYSEQQALVRSKTVIYTQIGYISMKVVDDLEVRYRAISDYVEVFTGQVPSPTDIQRFVSRHSHKQSITTKD